MIHWLLESFTAHPELAHGAPPTGLLSAAEEAKWATFKVGKRRREWLLGRWTAKQLVQSIITLESGDRIDLQALTIANDADGAPFITLASPTGPAGNGTTASVALPGLVLSISHRGDYSLCAVVEDGRRLGADIEQIEPQSETFIADYLTAEERALVARAPIAARDRTVIAIWSAKEAALKALRVGLSVDTRAVTCLIEPELEPARIWKSFEVYCNMEFFASAPKLCGWWRAIPNYVLTLVAETRTDGKENGPDREPIIKNRIEGSPE
ncbi:MAG: 4'-phosphopantetheinyl transferase superfamily protein [Anaerolineae bacterium]